MLYHQFVWESSCVSWKPESNSWDSFWGSKSPADSNFLLSSKGVVPHIMEAIHFRTDWTHSQQGQLRRWYFDRYMVNTKANVLLPLSQKHVMCKTGSRSTPWVPSGCLKGSGKSRVLLGSKKIRWTSLDRPWDWEITTLGGPKNLCCAYHTNLLARWDYKCWLYRRWLRALWLSGPVASQCFRVANWAGYNGNNESICTVILVEMKKWDNILKDWKTMMYAHILIQ